MCVSHKKHVWVMVARGGRLAVARARSKATVVMNWNARFAPDSSACPFAHHGWWGSHTCDMIDVKPIAAPKPTSQKPSQAYVGVTETASPRAWAAPLMLRGEVPELRRVLLCQALLQQRLRLRRVLPRILEDWDVRRYIPVLRLPHTMALPTSRAVAAWHSRLAVWPSRLVTRSSPRAFPRGGRWGGRFVAAAPLPHYSAPMRQLARARVPPRRHL